MTGLLNSLFIKMPPYEKSLGLPSEALAADYAFTKALSAK
jgi:hypothetical protein